MNESINIPAILKGKPQGTKLHDLVRGIDVFLTNVVDDSNEVHCTFEKNGLQMLHYSSKGTLVGFENGMVVLLPSEEMQDWSKFAWKKGDVLVCTDGKAEIIFERFDDDNYTSFVGKHYLESYGKDGDLLDYEQELFGDTANYTKESDETIQCYINTIEERLGGKLNRKTLEIEKLEFKDGDIVSSEIRFIDSEDVIVETYIVHNDYLHGEKLNYYAGYNGKASMIDYNSFISPENTSVKNTFLRYATEEEKQQLFEALAKENKAWDAEKKEVVDLKPKVEFKTLDYVLCKSMVCYEGDAWNLFQYAYQNKDGIHIMVGGSAFKRCIPYKGNEHLLGTTKEVEG